MTFQNPSKRRLSLALLLSLFLVVMQVMVVNAGLQKSLHFSVACDGFWTNDGGVILTRDNTGVGSEMIYISAVDGMGTQLYMSSQMAFLVNGQLYFGEGVRFDFESTPVYNPLTVSVVSPAGNGLGEQVIYAANGYCSGLPTITDDGTILDAETSPSVPLNAEKPLGVNPENSGQMYPGHLVVDTSWLNVRSGDNIKYTIVGRVAGAEELKVLGVNLDRTWWYIEAGEVVGWVNNEHVVVRGDLSDTPVVSAMGDLSPVRFYVYIDVPLWGLPGKGGGQLCWIAGDLEYLVRGQSPSGLSIAIEAVCDGVVVMGWLPVEEGAIRNFGDFAIPVLSY